VRDPAVRLEVEMHRTLAQLIGVLPRSCHRRGISSRPASEPPTFPGSFTCLQRTHLGRSNSRRFTNIVAQR
jgi:hypothetical protein